MTSDITPQLRALIAEKQGNAHPRARPAHPMIAEIKRASTFVDQGRAADAPGWPPSALMLIGFCTVLTSGRPGARERAEEMASEHLAEARRRYAAGFFANPFGGPVRRDRA